MSVFHYSPNPPPPMYDIIDTYITTHTSLKQPYSLSRSARLSAESSVVSLVAAVCAAVTHSTRSNPNPSDPER